MLAECYVRRDRVAVLAFRGSGSDLVLPPTRSLVRAKRALAGLPGGGGTPLASALDAAAELAAGIRRQGGTPNLVVLTDGRANVARDGTGGRELAATQALEAARAMRVLGIRAVLIDTAARPSPAARALGEAMGAIYLPLPQADAHALDRAIKAGLG
jgi:magnesium chelatase subunit D